MDIDALRTFLVVRETRGFSAAAEKLFRSQPAISRRIAVLEDEIGAPLFERVTGGVVLSEAGETLLPFARRAVAATEDCAVAMADLKTGRRGAVRLAVVGTLANAALTSALAAFRAEAPDVSLEVRTANSVEVSALVAAGEAGIGLRYRRDPSAELFCEHLMDERLAVVAAPDCPRAGRPVGRFADLAEERWFAFPQTDRPAGDDGRTLHAQFLARGVSDLNWAPIDSLTAQKRLVEAGFGLALMPESAVTEELARGALVRLEVTDLDAATPVYLVTRAKGYLSPASLALAERLRGAWG